MIEIRRPGLFSSIQDAGRFGLRHLGVPQSGVLVPAWMSIANRLVGNPESHPVLECFEGGLELKIVERPVKLALAGDARLEMHYEGDEKRLENWCSHTLPPGSVVRLHSTGRDRLAVMALAGLLVEPHLGSCSTYAKAGLGGLDGRTLAAGDHLDLAEQDDAALAMQLRTTPYEPARERGPLVLRAVPGPQDDAFTGESLRAFFSDPYRLSADIDRMGARLEGPALMHRDAAARDIVSDAIVPGSVQVPGNGLPIVLLADAHTAGGYPKIATVISSDLPLLGRARPGDAVMFERVDVADAIDIVRQTQRRLEAHLKRRIAKHVAASLDTDRLLRHNLIDGVTDGRG